MSALRCTTPAQAQHHGYIVTRSVSRENVHYRHCKGAGIPFVAIIPRGRLAYVRLDMFPTPHDLTAEAQAVAESLVMAHLVSEPGSHGSYGAEGASVTTTALAAPDVAMRFLSLARAVEQSCTPGRLCPFCVRKATRREGSAS